MTHTEILYLRLQRKLDKRDKKIAGLERRIIQLESILGSRVLDVKQMGMDVERAVEHALCNVRMIPVHGMMKTSKILEIRTVKEEEK